MNVMIWLCNVVCLVGMSASISCSVFWLVVSSLVVFNDVVIGIRRLSCCLAGVLAGSRCSVVDY